MGYLRQRQLETAVQSLLLYMQVLLAFFGAGYLCHALSHEADQLDRIKHLSAGASRALNLMPQISR